MLQWLSDSVQCGDCLLPLEWMLAAWMFSSGWSLSVMTAWLRTDAAAGAVRSRLSGLAFRLKTIGLPGG
jgi:hypothetical protein